MHERVCVTSIFICIIIVVYQAYLLREYRDLYNSKCQEGNLAYSILNTKEKTLECKYYEPKGNPSKEDRNSVSGKPRFRS